MAILNNTTISGSLTVTGNIKENGTLLVNKYLGLTAKAADSDKLDGEDSSYYLDYNNFTNTPDIPTETTVSNWGFTKNAGTVTSVDSVSPSSGNVALSAVRYVSQTLSDDQKTQARTNIGAGTSNFTGYTSSNKLSTDYINNVAGWTSNEGTVTQVKLGTTAYDPASGVISLPAYPTKASWNYDDTYLKLSGGTLTDALSITCSNVAVPLEIKSTGTTDSYVKIWNKDNSHSGFLGADTSGFLTMYENNEWRTLATRTWVENKGYTTNTGTITGVSVNGTSVATSGVANITSVPWSIISSKPTIPATNVIPTTTTASKVLLSTTTSGTAAWSSWSTAGLLKTNTSGVVSVDTTSYLSTTLSTSNNQRYLVGSSSTTSASLNTNSSCYMLNGELYSNGKNVAYWHNHLNTSDFPAAPASVTGTTIKRGYAALGCSTTNKFVIVFGYIPTGTKTTTVTFFGLYAGQGSSSTLVAFTNKPFVMTSNYSSGDAQSQRTIPTNITTTGFTCGNNTGQAVAWIAFGFTTATLAN